MTAGLAMLLVAGAPAGGTALLPPSARREARLGGAELLALGEHAERKRDLALARNAYSALTADRQPSIRNEARFRLARIHAASGEWSPSATLLRAILDEDPGAARVRLELASILARMGDEGAARRELRAAQAARPPPALARQIARYADVLRDRRPYGGELRFAFAPDSNINRATAEDRLATVIGDFEIGADGKARSGVGVSVEGTAFGRLPVTRMLSLVAQGGARSLRYKDGRFDRLTIEGRAAIQVAAGSDRLSLTLASQRHSVGNRVALTSSASEADWQRPLSSRTQLRVGAGVAALDNRFNDLEDGKLASASVSLDHAMSPVVGVILSLQAARRSARDPAYSTRSVQAAAGGWREFGRITLSLSAGIGSLRADDRLAILPKARRDRNLTASAVISSRHLSWRGLAPNVRLTVERVRSNIAFHDMSRRGLEIGFSRAF